MSVNQDMFAKITMAFWFQVSGYGSQEACSLEGTIHHLRLILPFSQLTASDGLTQVIFVPMFSPIHSTYVHIIAVDHLVSPLILTPEP